MKKLFLLVSAILLVAAGCNSQQAASQQPNQQQIQQTSQQTPNQQTEQPSAKLGPMPKMTYKVTSSSCAQGNQYSNIALYADGSQAAVFKAPVCNVDKVVFRAGNSQVVYFSIEPYGLGGYYSYKPSFDLYKLDLIKKIAEKIDTGGNWIGGLDFSKDLTEVIYAPYETAGQGVVVQNLATGAKQTFPPVPSTGKERTQIGNVKFSPDMNKAAIAVAYGPDKKYGEIYILDLNAKTYTLYKKIDSGHLQINGWKNNSEVDWTKIQ